MLYTVQFRSLDFWDTKHFLHWVKNSMPFLLHWIQTDSCWLKTSLVSKFMFNICDDVMGLSYVFLVCLINRVVFCSLLADCMQCLLHYCGYGRRTYIICRCRVCLFTVCGSITYCCVALLTTNITFCQSVFICCTWLPVPLGVSICMHRPVCGLVYMYVCLFLVIVSGTWLEVFHAMCLS